MIESIIMIKHHVKLLGVGIPLVVFDRVRAWLGPLTLLPLDQVVLPEAYLCLEQLVLFRQVLVLAAIILRVFVPKS